MSSATQKRDVRTGSSMYEIDVPLSKLEARIGIARAERIWGRSRMALDALRARTRSLGIDADCETRDSLYLEGSSLDADGLRVEADARRRKGFEAKFVDRRAVKARYGIDRRAGILSFDKCEPTPSCSQRDTSSRRAYRARDIRLVPHGHWPRSHSRASCGPTSAKIAAIETKLARLLPWVDPRAEYAWTGNFGGSRTGTPSIGPVPHMPNCYAVLGYGGNGITFSMMAAQILRGIISGSGDADSDLFSFTRCF